MNIVIAGDGEVGFHLAEMLESEDHDITIVDPHSELLEMLSSHTDVMTITGNSTSIKVLEQAKVNKADLLISVVHNEEVNLVTCMLGKQLGAKRTIARINNVEYLTPANEKHFQEMGIDALVCPERIAAKKILKLLSQSTATEIIDFSEGKLSLYLIRLEQNALVIGKTLSQIAQEYPILDFRCIAIYRRGKTIIPSGEDHFEVGDLSYVITKPNGIKNINKLGGKTKIDIKNVMIIGGGRIGRKTARELEKKVNVKLIDIDKERCERLTENIRNTLIINGDSRDVNLLENEGIRNIDAFIAVTNSSETNIFNCLLAKEYGVPKVIPSIENVDYFDISKNIGIDTIINKKLITASYIVRFTLDEKVSEVKCLSGIAAEALEFIVKEKSQATKKPIRKLKIPDGAIIGGIIRGNKSFIATGDLQINANDKVVVFALPKANKKIKTLFV
ncbi:MAG: Trk system potassium transporter TrkA [Bacteroidota bacterium]|nr:Trk system potassium transporter TrkA [Bacteroidota bacterium]